MCFIGFFNIKSGYLKDYWTKKVGKKGLWDKERVKRRVKRR